MITIVNQEHYILLQHGNGDEDRIAKRNIIGLKKNIQSGCVTIERVENKDINIYFRNISGINNVIDLYALLKLYWEVDESVDLIEEVDADTIYLGYGKTNACAIKKYDAGTYKWADGTNERTKDWANRASYTYSEIG